MAPLLVLHGLSPEDLVAAARAQTVATHNQSQVLACAELFSRAVGAGAGRAGGRWRHSRRPWTKRRGAMKSPIWWPQDWRARGAKPRQAILDLGQACEVDQALPSTVHLIATYPDDLRTALIENIMAGGDSAGPGGPWPGCCSAPAWVPGQFRPSGSAGINAYPRISELLASV